MNCYQCGGVYEAKSDSLEIFDLYVGRIEVRGIPYYQCRDCHDILYTKEMSRAIEAERNKRIHELLYQLPLGDFVNSAEAASILGVSRQALHKNRRINHGFIHQTEFAGVTVYLKQSVLRFKETGDGRFPLQPRRYGHPSEYMQATLRTRTLASYEDYQRSVELVYAFSQRKHVSQKEPSYAS